MCNVLRAMYDIMLGIHELKLCRSCSGMLCYCWALLAENYKDMHMRTGPCMLTVLGRMLMRSPFWWAGTV